jgi:hypothetical protein
VISRLMEQATFDSGGFRNTIPRFDFAAGR